MDIGLGLGLYEPTLSEIKAQCNNNANSCMRECLSNWLKKIDNVESHGNPSVARLADAVENIDKSAANKIRQSGEFYSHKRDVCFLVKGMTDASDIG